MLLTTVPADASPASRQRTREAFGHAYGLDFAAAYQAFEEAAALDPADPGPPRGIAAVACMETLFTQGVATFEAFTGQVSSKNDVVRPPVPAALSQKFRTHVERAWLLAEERLKQAADADAYYQLGATAALSALHMAAVEGRMFSSFTEGRRAVKAMERARALDPRRRETALVLGMSRYAVSTMSVPVRMLAAMSGLSGGRDEGLALIEEAASPGTDTEADALLVLMIVSNREGRYADAAGRLERLQTQFPTNRLIALNDGATAIQASQFERAERRLLDAMQAYDLRAAPAVLGEEALWHLKVATSRAALGRAEDARADLSKVLAAGPRDWVRGRAHAELGKLALASREHSEARRQFAQAVDVGQRSGDGSTVREIKELMRRVHP